MAAALTHQILSICSPCSVFLLLLLYNPDLLPVFKKVEMSLCIF